MLKVSVLCLKESSKYGPSKSSLIRQKGRDSEGSDLNKYIIFQRIF